MPDRLLSPMVDSRSIEDRAPAGAAFRGLERVRTLAEVIGEDGERVPVGSTGTVVAVWAPVRPTVSFRRADALS